MKRNKKYLLNFLKVKRQLKLRNIPIMYEFVILTGVVFVIIFALSWILLTSFKIDKEKSTLAVVNQTNNQVINKVDEYVSDIINLTKIPLFSDNFISSNSQETFVNELSLFSKTNTSTLEFQKYVGQIAYMIFNSRSYVNSVFVFNLNGKSEYRCYNNAFLPDSIDLNKEMWFKRSIDARGKPFIISTFSLPGYMDSNNAPHYMFSVSRGIMDFTESKVQGNILVNCDIGIFSSFCKKMLIVPNQRIVIINKNGNVVYDTEESNITNKFDSQFYQLVRNGVVGTKKINKNGIKYLVSYNTSELTDWKIVNIVSENELFSNINRTRNFFAVISFFLITLTLFLLLLLSRQIIYPLKKLVHLMKLVERGDFDVKIKMNSRNEFGQLARTFNNMTRRIKRLINEVYVDKIKQKDLELQMLQNQINPHFLYNTLESIHMVAEINNDMEASQMSRSLGRILRYGISSKSQIVTIKQEVDHLNDYILLQKVRFSRLYEITVNVNDDIYENRIIKLILQPLLENAVYHGLSSKSKGGKIEVLGYSKEDCIIFEVRDNGLGMDIKQTKIINNYINDLDNSMNSIGLKNVHKRIQLYYGNEYGIEVRSTLGTGTNILITLPSMKVADSHVDIKNHSIKLP